MEGDRQHRAERRAARHAERVGRRERIAQQRLEDDAGERERAADQRRREDARQPGDEEDLRVDVVGERDRPIEHARQRDRRAADERRQRRAAASSSRAEAGDVATIRRPRYGCTSGTRADRRDRQVAGARVKLDVGVDAVERAHVRGREHVRRRTLRQHAAVARAGSDGGTAPRPGSGRASTATIVVPRSRFSAREQLLHFELMAEVERRRRLVEQQQLGRLRQRAGDDDALLFAAAQRARTARASNADVPVAASACCAIARSSGPSSAKVPRCGKAAHQHDVDAR